MMNYNFDIMQDDDVIVRVRANIEKRVAEFEQVEQDEIKLPEYLYGARPITRHEPSFYWLEKFVDSRTFPRDRDNCSDLLAMLDLNRYDIWEIARKTHGVFCTDPYWYRFEGETLTREELRCRYGI